MPLKPLDRASGQPGRWGESCTGVEISHVGDAARAAGVAPLGAAPAAAAVPAPAFETPRHPRRTLAPRLRLGAPTKLRWDPALPQHIPSADTAPITLHWDTVDNCPTTPGRTAPPCSGSDFLRTTVTLVSRDGTKTGNSPFGTPRQPGTQTFTARPRRLQGRAVAPAATTVTAATPSNVVVIRPMATASQRRLDFHPNQHNQNKQQQMNKGLGPPLRVPKAPATKGGRAAASAAHSPGRRKMRRKQGHHA